MIRTIIITSGLVAAMLLSSCAGVDFDQDDPAYLDRRLEELPGLLLAAEIVLDEEGRTLTGRPLTVREFLVLMISAEPLMRNSWISANVVHNDEGAAITFRQYNRGNLIVVNKINLVYQLNMKQARVESIEWDDKLAGEKQDLVTIEEKVGYVLLVSTFLLLQ